MRHLCIPIFLAFTQKLWNKNYRISPNPVEQNYSHIKALEELLGQRIKQPIVSIVVFPSAFKFYVDGYQNVGSVDDMINSMATHTEKVYRFDEAKNIIETICSSNMKSGYSHQHHISRVKSIYS